MRWWPWKRTLDAAAIAAAVAAIEASDDAPAAWEAARPLREALPQRQAAVALAACVPAFGPSHGPTLAAALLADHGDLPEVLAALGEGCEAMVDIDDLNRAAPDEPWLGELVARLDGALVDAHGSSREPLLAGLATAAKIWGRRGDTFAARAHAELCARSPDHGAYHYSAGLFCKTRGRWSEGQAANQRSLEVGNDRDPVWWNLGICATGAGDGAVALTCWKHLNQKIAPGRFGLPEGSYPITHVRLAQRPLAERDAHDDTPGVEENVWVERLSPCHGIIRVGVFSDELGVDYGDVVLFDGAPIGYRGGDPIFPHLATLRRPGYRVWRFAGVQAENGQLQDLSGSLPDDAVVYVWSESVRFLCLACARGRSGELPDHEHASVEHRIVRGKICAPPHVTAAEVLAAIDAAIATASGAELVAPDLCVDAGDGPRAVGERARFAQLIADEPPRTA